MNYNTANLPRQAKFLFFSGTKITIPTLLRRQLIIISYNSRFVNEYFANKAKNRARRFGGHGTDWRKPRRVSPPQRRNKIRLVFCRDMCVAENTSRPANVQIGRPARAVCALQRGAIFLPEKALPFSTDTTVPAKSAGTVVMGLIPRWRLHRFRTRPRRLRSRLRRPPVPRLRSRWRGRCRPRSCRTCGSGPDRNRQGSAYR